MCFRLFAGQRRGGRKLLNEFLEEEGLPPNPERLPLDPEPEPEPEPEPTPEEVGFRLSDETIERISNLWLPVNWSPGDFGQAYAINCSFDPVNETSMVEFEYH